MVGAGLGDAGGHRTHADFRHQLDRDICRLVDVLQIKDELSQVLDRIDVMVRRRRNQTDAGRRMACLGNRRIDLVAGKLTAFAGLGTLRHLDLDHVRIDQIFCGHAKAAGSHLLDGGALRVHGTVKHGREAIGFLAALTGVRLAADFVHRPGKRRVCLPADRTKGHGAGRKPLDDIGRRLDLVERHGLTPGFLSRRDLEQPANGVEPLGVLVHQLGKLPVLVLGIAAHRVLQQCHAVGRP